MTAEIGRASLLRRLRAIGVPEPPDGDLIIWYPVGKKRPLPEGYVPDDLTVLDKQGIPSTPRAMLRAPAITDLMQLLAAAATQGHRYRIISAYRSAHYQNEVFQQAVQQEQDQGAASEDEAIERANRYYALPGFSEHQLGTSVDISVETVGYSLVPELAQLPEGIGLADNAWRYGYLHAYPIGSELRTGYNAEPWHLRWVGRPLAKLLHRDGYMHNGEWSPDQSTLQEYLTAITSKDVE